MKKLQIIIYFIAIIATLCYVWWKYVPAVDGAYSFGNEKISWNLIIDNGVLKTINLENKITGEKLEPEFGSEDFVLRVSKIFTLSCKMVYKRSKEKHTCFRTSGFKMQNFS